MKLRLSLFSICAMLLMAGALFTSCTNTTTPPGNTTTAHTDTWKDVYGLSAGTTYQFSVTGSSTGTVITGVSSWNTGTVRVYWSRAIGDSSDVAVNTTATTSPSITWAAVTGGGTFRLYETSDTDPNHPSGLILGPNPRAVSISGSEKLSIDLVLKTEPSIALPQLSLVSADLNGTNGRVAKFGFTLPTAYFKGGLAAQTFTAASGDLSGLIGNNNFFDITDFKSDSSSAVIIVRTVENNYARVEIVAQAAKTTFNGVKGHFLWGDTPTNKRYIDVNVTYNPTIGSAYAAIFNSKDALLADASN